jgi:DNA-binding response OmpR family regulator
MAHILLADDDDAFRRMLQLTLTRMGHTVDEAHDGAQALKKFDAQPADLVIMDLIMPEKEGLETIREFRRNRVAVKILAISGGGRIDARDMLTIARQFGADHVLAKPFSNAELTAALKLLLPTAS